MIDENKQYKTRDGREVRIYATDCGGIHPVHGAILRSDGWVIHCWRSDGSDAIDSISNADLIEVKPRMKIERWVMVNRNGDYSLWLDKPSKAASVDAFGLTRISFEVEEGEGLDAV
jgi:hypothetical protein